MVITIIISVFNASLNLQRCIRSVIEQTYEFRELIIIDGASTDGSVDIIRENDKFISYWESEPDRGIYHAWNKALEHASGDWICFLGADDYFYSSKALEDISGHLIGKTSEVVYGCINVINKRGEILATYGEPWNNVKKRFKQTMCIPHPGMMMHRSLFELHGKFDETFRIAGDYEFLLRELLHADALFVPGLIMVVMEAGGISLSPANSDALLKETRRAQAMHGLTTPGFIRIMATVRVKLRIFLWRTIGEKRTRRILDMGRFLTGKDPFWTHT